MSELAVRGAPQDFVFCTYSMVYRHFPIGNGGTGIPATMGPNATSYVFRASDATMMPQGPPGYRENYIRMQYYFNMYQYYKISKIVIKFYPASDTKNKTSSIPFANSGGPFPVTAPTSWYSQFNTTPSSFSNFILLVNDYQDSSTRSNDLNEFFLQYAGTGSNMHVTHRPFEHVVIPQVQDQKTLTGFSNSDTYVDNAGNQWVPTRVINSSGAAAFNMDVAWYGLKEYRWFPFDYTSGLAYANSNFIGDAIDGIYTYTYYLSFKDWESRNTFPITAPPSTDDFDLSRLSGEDYIDAFNARAAMDPPRPPFLWNPISGLYNVIEKKRPLPDEEKTEEPPAKDVKIDIS